MDSKRESQIENYILNEDKLYQDWYTGFNQSKSEDNQYTVQVAVSIPSTDKVKELFDNWFNGNRNLLKDKICGEWGYCQKKEDFSQHEAQSIALLADFLTVILVIPVNSIATAIILRVGKYLDHLCECE
ncbi:hypothetical protein [Candidatus Parabeggiatoa sp. HSG14]|uniref:hypothetical protein n=1 Tax=Candidatus Parabeggiatoa sp. HSG14 TaxID=3055593 RepID=UPI0025A74BA0|nr:hypothetical protein [Thiotrichales bacterium HSG14]